MMKRKIWAILLIFVLLFSFSSFSYAKSLSSKEEFFNIFKSAEKVSKSKVSDNVSKLFGAGEFELSVSKDGSSDEEISLTGGYDLKSNKYLVSFNGIKLMLDMSEDKMYLATDNDNKVYLCDIPEEIKDEISDALDGLSLSDIGNQQEYSEKFKKILYEGLDAKWFSTTKTANGMKEYKLKMGDDELKSLVKHVISSIKNDKELLGLILDKINSDSWYEVTEEELLEMLDEFVEDFDELDMNTNIEISIVSKSTNVKDISKIVASATIEDADFSFELSGEDKKSLFKSKSFRLLMSYKEGEYNVAKFDGTISPKKVRIELQERSKSSSYDFSSKSNPVTYYLWSNVYKYEIYTKDSKDFKKSSNIVMEASEESRQSTLEGKVIKENSRSIGSVTIKSKDNKELLKSSNIVIFAHENEEIIIKTGDKKGLMQSNLVSVDYNFYGDVENLFVIKSNDKKALLKSTSLELDSEYATIKLETKDKKSFIKSKKIYFSIVSDDMEYTFERNDKEFSFYMKYTSLDYSSLFEVDEVTGTYKMSNPKTITNTIKGKLIIRDSYPFDKMINTKNAIQVDSSEIEDIIEAALKE